MQDLFGSFPHFLNYYTPCSPLLIDQFYYSLECPFAISTKTALAARRVREVEETEPRCAEHPIAPRNRDWEKRVIHHDPPKGFSPGESEEKPFVFFFFGGEPPRVWQIQFKTWCSRVHSRLPELTQQRGHGNHLFYHVPFF